MLSTQKEFHLKSSVGNTGLQGEKMELHCGYEGVRALVRWVIIEMLARNENRDLYGQKRRVWRQDPRVARSWCRRGMLLGPLLTLLVCM